MRGALEAEGVAPALLQSCEGGNPLSQSAIKALMHFMARECHWRIERFDWRVVHRTYHSCSVESHSQHFTALIGADAPIMALANQQTSGRWSFFDDVSAGVAAGGYYSHSVSVLPAQQLNADLSAKDRAWLAALSSRMQYDLKYWNPRTVGEVVFNFWD